MTSSVIGLDIGGTKIFAARYGVDDFSIQKEIRLPTESEKGVEHVLSQLVTALESVIDTSTQSIGIGWAGFVNPTNGFVYKSPNIKGFDNFALGEHLQKHFSIPLCIENDSRVFALAEQKINSPKSDSFLGIIIGTGVGSGFVLGGHIVHGDTYFAGEVGHMYVSPELEEAEDIFSGPALSRLFSEAIGEPSMRTVEQLLYTRRSDIEPLMDEVLDKMALWLYNLLLAYNPGKIVFGGGIGSYFLPHFEALLTQKLQHYIDIKGYPLPFDIGFSKLKNAGSLGAALLAYEKSSS